MADPAEILRQADALHLNKRFAEAAALYRQALSLDDVSADGWYGLGHCLLSARSYGDAADALQHTLTLQPDNAGARCNLAEALFQLGRVDEAVRHYLQAA